MSRNGFLYTVKIHRLLAQEFIPNSEGKPEINHIDGDRSNNSLTNLEWVTHAENVQHSARNDLRVYKTTEFERRVMMWAYIFGVCQSSMARHFNLSPSTVCKIIKLRKTSQLPQRSTNK